MKMHLSFIVASLATVLFLNANAQTNTFPSSGNVGIGTTSPASLLDVNGRSTFRHKLTLDFGTTNRSLQLRDSGLYISRASDGTYVSTITGEESINYNTIYHHNFFSNGSQILTIQNGGNVGIGTTSPGAKLEVNGTGIFSYPQSSAANNSTTGYGLKLGSAFYTRERSSSAGISGITYATQLFSLGAGATELYTADATPLVFGTDATERIRVASSGNIGIGTTSPSAQLHTTGTLRFTGLSNDNAQTRLLVSDANGNVSYRDVSTVSSSSGWSYNGNTVGALKKIGTTDNYDLPIITNNVERMRVLANGSVVIGTSAVPNSDAKFAVDGNMYSKASIVTQIGWADYVFHPAYKLPSLTEVEAYIKQHQHLQDIPSATEVEKEGVNLGDMSKNLLKKIEELTLYVIDQNKKIQSLQQEIKSLKRKK